MTLKEYKYIWEIASRWHNRKIEICPNCASEASYKGIEFNANKTKQRDIYYCINCHSTFVDSWYPIFIS